jgi:hypothetical protein
MFVTELNAHCITNAETGGVVSMGHVLKNLKNVKTANILVLRTDA